MKRIIRRDHRDVVIAGNSYHQINRLLIITVVIEIPKFRRIFKKMDNSHHKKLFDIF